MKTKSTYKNNLLHNDNGPAVISEDGDYKAWYINGKLHRLDGPAIEWTNILEKYPGETHKQWWIDGKRHKEDGPAVEYASGHKAWWVDGKMVRYEEKQS